MKNSQIQFIIREILFLVSFSTLIFSILPVRELQLIGKFWKTKGAHIIWLANWILVEVNQYEYSMSIYVPYALIRCNHTVITLNDNKKQKWWMLIHFDTTW